MAVIFADLADPVEPPQRTKYRSTAPRKAKTFC
jgi:hypothetical protein